MAAMFVFIVVVVVGAHWREVYLAGSRQQAAGSQTFVIPTNGGISRCPALNSSYRTQVR
jgi:hypothetical protein